MTQLLVLNNIFALRQQYAIVIPIRMNKAIGIGSSAMDLIEVQKKLAKEGKDHIGAVLLQNYATNRGELTKNEVAHIEEHIKNCERCSTQLKDAQRILNL